jgi:hypothetical protein
MIDVLPGSKAGFDSVATSVNTILGEGRQ